MRASPPKKRNTGNMANLLDKITQLWVRLDGKRIHPEKEAWLIGPIGDPDLIADQFVEKLAKKDNLTITSNRKDYGLLESFHSLGLSPEETARLRPEIVDFYEKTYNYEFEVWSEWKGIFRFFGWLLSVLFSKRLKQLNLPLNPMDASRGLDSNIIKLSKGSRTIWTIWYRTLKSNKQVIYSGVYTTCKPAHHSRPLLKVIFPLPNGNATVIMTTKVEKDGSLLLSSDGEGFGDQGFYFTLTNRKGSYWAKYVKPMHEWIRVYVDAENVLRADHQLNFFGLRFLNLHYKMTEVSM